MAAARSSNHGASARGEGLDAVWLRRQLTGVRSSEKPAAHLHARQVTSREHAAVPSSKEQCCTPMQGSRAAR